MPRTFCITTHGSHTNLVTYRGILWLINTESCSHSGSWQTNQTLVFLLHSSSNHTDVLTVRI